MDLIQKQYWEKKGEMHAEGEAARGVSVELPLLFNDPYVSGKEYTQGKVRLRLRLIVPRAGTHTSHIEDEDAKKLLEEARSETDSRPSEKKQ